MAAQQANKAIMATPKMPWSPQLPLVVLYTVPNERGSDVPVAHLAQMEEDAEGGIDVERVTAAAGAVVKTSQQLGLPLQQVD